MSERRLVAQPVTLREHLEAISQEEWLFQRLAQEQAACDKWRQRASLAVRKGLDDLARAALQRERRCERMAAAYRTQYQEQQLYVRQLELRLRRSERDLAGPGESAANRRARELLHALQPDPLADRLVDLEHEERLERDLADLRARLARKDD